jgi:hypothetical protein
MSDALAVAKARAANPKLHKWWYGYAAEMNL